MKCGWKIENEYAQIRYSCRSGLPPDYVLGLGDRVEQALTFLGITQERYTAFKEKYGKMPDCDCLARKRWMNEFGREFGDLVKLKWLIRWFHGK